VLGADPPGLTGALALVEPALDPLAVTGRPLFAGQRSAPLPDDPLARLWRILDALREYRGDSHTLTWVGAGLDAVEIGMLSDLYWGTPLRGHTGGRGWTAEDMDGALDRLRSRGLMAGDEMTPAGRRLRDDIETRTDAHMAPALAAIATASTSWWTAGER
jgi:hypothetical protein